MAPNNKRLNREQSQNTELILPNVTSAEIQLVDHGQLVLLSPEELQTLRNFNCQSIPNIVELLNLGPIVLNTIGNTAKVQNVSDEDFKFDHDPVPFLEQLLDEYDAQEAEELFEYDANPVLFLEKLLEDNDGCATQSDNISTQPTEKEELGLPQNHQSVVSDDDFVFDHDPVPFLEELLAEYDTQEAEELKSKLHEDIIVPSDDLFNESFMEYNGESISFYNRTVADISAFEENTTCQQKMTKSVNKNQRTRAPYIKSRTFVNSKLHRK